MFADKLNEPVEQVESAIFRRGNLLEKPLLEAASDFLNHDIYTPDCMYRDGRLTVTLDGVDNSIQPEYIVEAKTTTRYSIYDQNDLPAEWLWQGWAQQAVLECSTVWFSVLDRDLRISVVELPKNESAIDALRLEAQIFGDWIDQRVLPDEELNNFSADDITRIYKVQPTSIELDVVVVDWLVALEDARAQSKQATEMETKAKDAIAQMLKGNEVGLVNGVQVVSWKQQAGKMSFDLTRFKSEQPELVKQYEKQSNPYRVMRTHRKKAK